MENIEKLANLGGTVITVIVFILHLNKKDEAINIMVNNHLEHSGKIIEKNSDVITKMEVALKELCVLFRKNNRGERGLRGKAG